MRCEAHTPFYLVRVVTVMHEQASADHRPACMLRHTTQRQSTPPEPAAPSTLKAELIFCVLELDEKEGWLLCMSWREGSDTRWPRDGMRVCFDGTRACCTPLASITAHWHVAPRDAGLGAMPCSFRGAWKLSTCGSVLCSMRWYEVKWPLPSIAWRLGTTGRSWESKASALS